MSGRLNAALFLLPLLGACISTPHDELMATVTVVPDFDTYQLRRVGLVPFTGDAIGHEQARELQSAFFAEMSASTGLEIVPLKPQDLEEVPRSEPYRRGWYRPQTIIDLARRFRLDGIFIGTVTELHTYPPQRLGIQLDLVASETGMVLWNSSIYLDAGQEKVRRSVEHWAQGTLGVDEDDEVHIILLSPRRFTRFAAYQLSRLL